MKPQAPFLYKVLLMCPVFFYQCNVFFEQRLLR